MVDFSRRSDGEPGYAGRCGDDWLYPSSDTGTYRDGI